eukprot:gene4151-5239_t
MGGGSRRGVGGRGRRGQRRVKKMEGGDTAGGSDPVPGGAAGEKEDERQREREREREEKPGPSKPAPPQLETLYPDAYNAGKIPREMVQDRQYNRTKGISFTYAVRFRSGPVGVSFDNKSMSYDLVPVGLTRVESVNHSSVSSLPSLPVPRWLLYPQLPNMTIVETVVKNSFAEGSDIAPGDRLIAVDYYNTTEYPAKLTLRLLQGLAWPRLMVFEVQERPDEKE